MNKTLNRTLQRVGIGLMASASLLMASTTFITPGANADTAPTASAVTILPFTTDGLGKKDALSDLDMLVQKEVQLPDGSFSDGDPIAAQTTPIDEIPTGYAKNHNVKQAGIPTVAEGGSATFRIRVYPRRMVDQFNGAPSLVTVFDTTDAPGTPGDACSQTTPILVPGDSGLEYTCTLTNLTAKAGSTEDLINTIRVVSTDVDGKNPMERTEQAAVNVESPDDTTTTTRPPLSACLTIKKYVRAAGATPFNDAQLPTDADVPTIPIGGTAEYQIVVTNTCDAPVSNVNVTDDDTTAACLKTIGTMGPNAVVTYTNTSVNVTNDPALAATLVTAAPGCVSTNVQVGRTSTATVTGTGPNDEPLTANDPVNIKVETPVTTVTTVPSTTVPSTTVPATTVPVTTFPPTPPSYPYVTTTVAAPTTTAAPTTVAPTTAAPTTTAAPVTTAAPTTVPAVAVLATEIQQPTTTATLAVTGSSQSKPMLLAGLLIFMAGCAMVLASKAAPGSRRD